MTRKKLLLIIVLVLIFIGTVSTFAITYSGEAGKGSEKPVSGESSSFCLLHADIGCEDNQVSGYRFTVVDCKGNQRGKTIDVFRNQYVSSPCENCEYSGIVFWNEYGYSAHTLIDETGCPMSKLKLRASASNNTPFFLEQSKQNKLKESQLDKTEPLPGITKIGNWIKEEKNYQSISSICTDCKELNFGDIIIIEPLFSCRIEDKACALSCSDLARLSLSYYDNCIPSGVSSGYSFAWLRKWVLKEFPNRLSVTENRYASMLSLATGKKLENMATPMEILNGAYGMAMGIELYSSEKPTLLAEKVEIFDNNTLIQSCDNQGNTYCKSYLESKRNYKIKVYFSDESSKYKVNYSIGFEDDEILGTGFTTDLYYESTISFSSESDCYLLTIREDWISEKGMILQRGKETVFSLKGNPSQIIISMLNHHNEVITTAYQGQSVSFQYDFAPTSQFKRESKIIGSVSDTRVFTQFVKLSSVKRIILYSSEYNVPIGVSSLNCNCSCSEFKNDKKTLSSYNTFSVCIADLEIQTFHLTDLSGNKVSLSNISRYTSVVPVAKIKNNTSVKVYAEVFLLSWKKTISLAPNESVTLTFPSIKLNDSSFSLTVETYLEDQNRNASCERDSTNNKKTLSGNTLSPIQGDFIDSVYSYHKGTNVYCSAVIQNQSSQAQNNLTAYFYVTSKNGSNLHSAVKTVSLPKESEILLYFPWTVQEKAAFFQISVFDSSNTMIFTLKKIIQVSAIATSSISDTIFESKTTFKISSSPHAKNNEKLSWREWDNNLNKISEKEILISGSLLISTTDNSRTIKSGYGFYYNFEINISNLSLCTEAQLIYAIFPESNYSTQLGSYQSLSSDSADILHFVPVWYPDGEYTFYLVFDDIWSPLGKTTLIIPTTITIQGNLFEDWNLRT